MLSCVRSAKYVIQVFLKGICAGHSCSDGERSRTVKKRPVPRTSFVVFLGFACAKGVAGPDKLESQVREG